ncbi:MAG: ACP S-malonyltransferase [Methylomonas sp.]|nr:ACP S-malonyltransferase [Methylomonas sp.]PPD19684.1 MAG: [acyl-carrier-protein] S-malonyltransferase [Methylomonas sp.]PPD25819.1 MAG: [acyl-carrier-protein] S-malonyltransferase [Methylomonas sp.]PPD37278.1 MAG: [acyl-carrier-protein] S-malonyltransferase [Methylomonas sp.]PPD39044.1 MAG: [acyl-carrier-protein] S-malonyltransferase [Methylomonas sp.]
MNGQRYNLAFVFPGQGSQSVGMMSKLAAEYPIVKQTFEQAADVLGLDLWNLAENGPEDTLNQTCNTQPAMLAAGVAVWRVWCESSGIRPDWMAGHSLGEYTALVCSGAMAFDDAIRLVAERGRLMQQAVPVGVGAMAAILGMEDHHVVNACADVARGDIVAPANFNAPGQVVIAGQALAVERAMATMKELGAKRVLKLPVSVPSHCLLMEAASDQLATVLETIDIAMPGMTLIHNADVKSHGSPEVIRFALKEQLFKPVRWVESIKFMHEQGVTQFIELGPGKVLMGLNKRIAPNAHHMTVFDPESLTHALEYFHG